MTGECGRMLVLDNGSNFAGARGSSFGLSLRGFPHRDVGAWRARI